MRPYLDALKRDLSQYGGVAPHAEITQFHWGGGSPNFLSADEIARTFDLVTTTFSRFGSDAELSIELDPRATSTEHLLVLRRLGFTRLSFGVQDFDPSVQKIVRREQSFEKTVELVQQARALGFHGINLDLMYGLPAQTDSTWKHTVRRLISIRPDRIALYGYAHVAWRSPGQRVFERKASLPSAIDRIRLFHTALTELTIAGYRYIGMDHFALADDELSLAMDQGRLRRNFMGYTTCRGERIFGIGASAISSLESCYAQNVTAVDAYQQQLSVQSSAVTRGIARSIDDRIRAWVIEEIMCHGTVRYTHFSAQWKVSFHDYFNGIERSLTPLMQDGLLTVNNDGFAVTPTGRFLLRVIASQFDAYLQHPEHAAIPRYSRAI